MIASVQYLRIFAVLLVVLFHGRVYSILYPEVKSTLDYWFAFGRIGVDIFFMISGFVMYITEYDADHSPTGRGKWGRMLVFLTKRLIRVVPIYWLVTVIYYFLTVKYPNTQLVVSSLFFIPPEHIDQAVIKDPPFFAYPALIVGWTLNYEMWFYLVFALSLLFCKWRIVAIVCFLTVPLLFSWAYTQSFLLHPHQGIRYNIPYLSLISNPILLEFLAGIFLGAIYKSPQFTPSKQDADCALILALALLLHLWLTGYFYGGGNGLIFHYYF